MDRYKLVTAVVLQLAALCVTLYVVNLVVQLHQLEALEVESRIMFCNTALTSAEHVMEKAYSLIVIQNTTINYQRRLISKLAESPCPERAFIRFTNGKDFYTTRRR